MMAFFMMEKEKKTKRTWFLFLMRGRTADQIAFSSSTKRVGNKVRTLGISSHCQRHRLPSTLPLYTYCNPPPTPPHNLPLFNFSLSYYINSCWYTICYPIYLYIYQPYRDTLNAVWHGANPWYGSSFYMYKRREKALFSFGQHQQTPEIIIKQKEKDNRAEQKTRRRRRRGMAPCDIPFRTLVITGKTKKGI